MLKQRKTWLVVLGLLLLALVFRIAIAHFLPNDDPDDGRVYAQLARNVLEQHVYSLDTEPPYQPTLIRLPGYPLFLAGIYSLFGHTNNSAVRIVQALLDTGTCVLVALLAFYWEPDERRKRATAIAAFVLAALCPFTTIYVATILTETATSFLAIAMCLAATLAFRAASWRRSITWWCVTGLLAGIAVLFRPDSGLFAAAIGITLVIAGTSPFWSAVASAARHRFGSASETSQPAPEPKRRRRFALPAHSKEYLLPTIVTGAVFSIAFALVLVPWTIRNRRIFHVFQPLAPAHAEMPGEFVARGYLRWLRTWVDDPRYTAPMLWAMDSEPIKMDDIPDNAFDSDEERQRVAALFEQYNHPPEDEANQEATPTSTPSPTPTGTPQQGAKNESANQNSAAANDNTQENSAEENSDEGNQNSEDQADENDNEADQSDEEQNQNQSVEMTPQVDAGFAQLAQERIARHPLRYYLWLPIKRATALWFDTHSQYYPFEGELLPLDDLDHETHQHIWLPLFAALTWVYTLLGVLGGWILWSTRSFAARRWLLLAGLVIFLRLAFFSTIENPEPRYVVEIFPFLAMLGAFALTRIISKDSSSAPA
jgi:4-amino-4-deoxy-L-arabinose transferase-like glycosyltransferase